MGIIHPMMANRHQYPQSFVFTGDIDGCALPISLSKAFEPET